MALWVLAAILHTFFMFLEWLAIIGAGFERLNIVLWYIRVRSLWLRELAIIVEYRLTVVTNRVYAGASLCWLHQLIRLPLLAHITEHRWLPVLGGRRRFIIAAPLLIAFFVVLKIFQIRAHTIYLLFVVHDGADEFLTWWSISWSADETIETISVLCALISLFSKAILALFAEPVFGVKLVNLLCDSAWLAIIKRAAVIFQELLASGLSVPNHDCILSFWWSTLFENLDFPSGELTPKELLSTRAANERVLADVL